jgi:hypothetical protein
MFWVVLFAFSPPTLSAKSAERVGHPVLCMDLKLSLEWWATSQYPLWRDTKHRSIARSSASRCRTVEFARPVGGQAGSRTTRVWCRLEIVEDSEKPRFPLSGWFQAVHQAAIVCAPAPAGP